MKTEALLACSFCGKSQTDVRSLVAGPGVYICDECVDLCITIISDHDGTDEQLLQTARRLSTALDRTVQRLRDAGVAWDEIADALKPEDDDTP